MHTQDQSYPVVFRGPAFVCKLLHGKKRSTGSSFIINDSSSIHSLQTGFIPSEIKLKRIGIPAISDGHYIKMAYDAEKLVSVSKFHPADSLAFDPCLKTFCLCLIQKGLQNPSEFLPIRSSFFGISAH